MISSRLWKLPSLTNFRWTFTIPGFSHRCPSFTIPRGTDVSDSVSIVYSRYLCIFISHNSIPLNRSGLLGKWKKRPHSENLSGGYGCVESPLNGFNGSNTKSIKLCGSTSVYRMYRQRHSGYDNDHGLTLFSRFYKTWAQSSQNVCNGEKQLTAPSNIENQIVVASSVHTVDCTLSGILVLE